MAEDLISDVELPGARQAQSAPAPVAGVPSAAPGPVPGPADEPVPDLPAEDPTPVQDVPQDIAPTPEDRSSDYMRHAEDLRGGSELDAVLERVRSRQQETAAPEAPEGAEGASAETGSQPEPEAAPTVEVRPLREGGYGAWVNGVLVAGGQTEKDAWEAGRLAAAPPGVMDQVGDVATDVVMGAVEAPRQAFGGAMDAVRETTRAVDDLADWLNENVADLTFSVPLPGVDEGETVDLNPTTLIRSVLPEIDAPRSTTGGAVRSIAQFITGFWGAGKVLRGAGAAVPASVPGGRAIEAAGKGMAADFTVFDPSEERLANIVQDVPELQNPVTEYLAADTDDSRIEGRIKNALEGAGLGVMTEGFLVSLRGLRGVRKARKESAAESVVARQKERFGEITERDFLPIGEPDSTEIILRRPTVTGKVKETDGKTVDPAKVGEGGTGEVFINWARIDGPEDIKEAMQAMADLSKEGIEVARRGVRSNEQTAQAAARMDPWDVLLSRREGQPLNAEESLALRQLWTSATDTLTDVAKRAAENPGEANMFAFRKMLAVHDAIQKEVIAARTETARALQSWRIPAGSGVERARAVQEMLVRNADDPNVHRELARRIAVLGDAGEIDKLNEVARRSATARTYDAVVQAWINGLLSGPKTHLVNMMSNTSVIFLTMGERATAARLARLMGDDASIQMGEATAQWFGMVQGLKDSFRLSSDAEKLGTVWRSIKTGESSFGLQKVDQPRQGALASEVWNVASDTPLGRTLDGLNVVTQIPGRALGAEDELFKTVGYRMELNAQALRQARSEVNAGSIPEAEFKARVNELVENPPEHIRLSAMDAATYQTFNNPAGKISRMIMKFRDVVPVLGPLIAPFVRTVGNIMKYTYERTPLAPLMSHVRADVAAGGARRELALTRMAVGTSIMFVTADMAMSGLVSGKGPDDPRVRSTMRRAGWQPYSVKVGDRWFAYNRMDPIGTLLGLSADMVDIIANGDMDDEKWSEDVERALIATAAAIGANSMNKAYLTGFSEIVEAMSDPTRNAEYWAQGVASSIMPRAVVEVRRHDDPYLREVRSLWDAVRDSTPGVSESLPLRRDLWGRPIDRRSGMGATFDALSPIYSSAENPEPIDTELIELGNGPSAMARRTSFDGAVINLDQYPGAYSRLVELAGNDLKLPKYGNKGAKDALNDIVTGKSPFSAVYRLRSGGPDGGKMTFIRALVSEYRQAAKDKLMQEYPEITVEVRRKLSEQQKWSLQ